MNPNFETTTHVGIAGDWHGNLPHALAVLKRLHGRGISLVFQLGDFGFYGSLLKHSREKFRDRIGSLLDEQEQYLFVTFGNHENYDLIGKLDVHSDGIFKGFAYEPEAPRILYFQRGQSLKVGGRNFLSCGGANSIDIGWRFAHNAKGKAKVWWPQEEISKADIVRTVEEARSLGTVDVFLAHDVFLSAPIEGTHRQNASMWTAEEFAFARKSREALELIAREALPTLWLHGHYHKYIETEVQLKRPRTKRSKKGRFTTESAVVRTVCLARDEKQKSTAILALDDLTLTVI